MEGRMMPLSRPRDVLVLLVLRDEVETLVEQRVVVAQPVIPRGRAHDADAAATMSVTARETRGIAPRGRIAEQDRLQVGREKESAAGGTTALFTGRKKFVLRITSMKRTAQRITWDSSEVSCAERRAASMRPRAAARRRSSGG
jgi:hypothetical protein